MKVISARVVGREAVGAGYAVVQGGAKQASGDQLGYSSLCYLGCIDRSRHDDLSGRKEPDDR